MRYTMSYLTDMLAIFEYIVICTIIIREKEIELERLYFIAANASWNLPVCRKMRVQENLLKATFIAYFLVIIVLPDLISLVI